MSVGLVLEGGGTRGAYTAGVLDAFTDYNLYFNKIYGVSAGACNALSYISKQRGRNFEIFYKYVRDPRYLSLKSKRKTGSAFGFDFIFGELSTDLLPFDYYEFFKSHMNLTVGTTDCKTGKPVYFTKKDMDNDFLAVRASASLPLVSQIVDFKGYKLLDGGIADPIAIEKSIADGNEYNIIVLTQHKEYRKPNKTDFPKPILKAKFKDYPNFVECMVKRAERYNRQKQLCYELERQGKAVVIQPPEPMIVGRYDRNTDKLKAVYSWGMDDAKNAMQKIRHFIELNS